MNINNLQRLTAIGVGFAFFVGPCGPVVALLLCLFIPGSRLRKLPSHLGCATLVPEGGGRGWLTSLPLTSRGYAHHIAKLGAWGGERAGTVPPSSKRAPQVAEQGEGVDNPLPGRAANNWE